MQSIIEAVKFLQAELQTEVNKMTFRWKASESPEEYSEVKPLVEAFTFDDTTPDGLPVHTPSVLLQPVSETGNVWHIVVYICVAHPAVQDKEIADPVEGHAGVYTYREGENFTSLGCRKELLKFNLLLTEQVSRALKRLSYNNGELRLSNISTNAPSPMLDAFPYCESTIEIDCSLSRSTERINSDLAALL